MTTAHENCRLNTASSVNNLDIILSGMYTFHSCVFARTATCAFVFCIGTLSGGFQFQCLVAPNTIHVVRGDAMVFGR